VQDLNAIFSLDGSLAKVISGYLPRAAQLEMAEAIDESIEKGQHLIAEAGTGTGKTFAYLVPAILSGKKVLVSTGTRNLQDQLFNNDLPLIRQALSVPFTASLLKGRSNYLCLYRLNNALQSTLGFSQHDATAINHISAWSRRTKKGDISEISEVAEDDPIWFQANSTVDNCLGQDCPDYAECFLMKARKKAQEADVLVINHHLLCADWSIKEIGYGELLPAAEVIIIDEAHQLAATASNFLGVSFSAKQLNDLCLDVLLEYHQDATDMPALRTACEHLQYDVKDLRLAFGIDAKKGHWRELENNPQVIAGLSTLKQQLQALIDQLELAAVRTKGLESCFKRAEELELRLHSIVDDSSGKWIQWYETFKNTFTLCRTPLDIAAEFKLFMEQHQATWIFTSATLSVANDFAHFKANLGIENTKSQSWDSPFEYSEQSLFYHPRGLLFPNDPGFVSSVVELAVPVIEASQGRTFMLFTSHRALQQAAELLSDLIDYPILVQGSRPKALLLEQFKQHGNAVLLGTSSFWEGVDVRGDALSCVIIDKLPFAAPGDPVLKARLDAMQKQGRNAFFEYQLPSAVITLRQGIGRLIRDVSDRGVLMLCDPRLLKKSYGRMFLESVPPMRRTRDFADVRAFFDEEDDEIISR
jgi:ATP-dependent DNA helicase DinG